MLNRLRQRISDERGFTLIELLVVILIIGILAAIAIPTFLNQKSKAYDSSAKELARTAETTAETYATDHNGLYEEGGTAFTQANLHSYETGLTLCSESESNACLKTATGGTNTYTVTTKAVNTGDEFTIARSATGGITRTCKSGKSGANTCSGSETSSW